MYVGAVIRGASSSILSLTAKRAPTSHILLRSFSSFKPSSSTHTPFNSNHIFFNSSSSKHNNNNKEKNNNESKSKGFKVNFNVFSSLLCASFVTNGGSILAFCEEKIKGSKDIKDTKNVNLIQKNESVLMEDIPPFVVEKADTSRFWRDVFLPDLPLIVSLI